MTNKTVKMSSIAGLPTRGSDTTICITKVHLHPLCVLVEFWGKFSQSRTAEYESLAKDIQSPGNAFQEMEGDPGDQCLVQIDGTWYRCRIVSRNDSKYSVFIIDKGMTYSTTSSKLAWGQKNHFQLPPEVEYCVLANVLPLSAENRWSPVAREFLRSLSGKSVQAHVQDVLVQHRAFLLHIPCISKQMYEMGFARKMSPDIFQDFLLKSLQSQSGVPLSLETLQVSSRVGEPLQKHELFLYPELPAGTVETVVVTDVTNPQRIFCQLKVFSRELKKLSEKITQWYEGKFASCIVSSEMIGFPCAARGSDGKWFRSVLQQVFPTSKVVEVLNVDYGTKQVVPVHNIRPLAAEFFRMPVVTYICSLYGIIDKGVGWTSSQIDYLRTLLLYKTVIAKFEYHSISEGVHYVTLYGDENTNLNTLFGSQESCLLDCEKTLADYAIRGSACSQKQERNETKLSSPALAVEEKEQVKRVEKLPVEDLPLCSTHVAVVLHVTDPSEFWIQTQNHVDELDKLMDSIYYLYKDSGHRDVVKNPTVGLYCAAKSEDGDYYRAVVSEVDDAHVKVFFVDYGNSEVVDRRSIRILPDEFRALPHLALKCTLAGIRPKDGGWNPSACDFFIKAVTNKTLRVQVTSKCRGGYAVHLTDPHMEGEKDVGMLMCSSGLAEKVDAQIQPRAKVTTQLLTPAPSQSPDARLSSDTRKNETCFQPLGTAEPSSNDRRNPAFKEHMFAIGSVLDISVSYIESPNDFWCQLVQNAGHLKLLMHNIQARYANSEFEPLAEMACVARHPENGMWYRALVIHKHETPHVNVLFVDYGQTETVSLYDLRRIDPEFLTLHGQAFRCSLLNPVNPTSATNEWNADAVARFQSFVETAASNFLVLKCTIYAVMYSEQKIVFNIVDLETPFESASNMMANLVKNAPLQKAGSPSFRLDSYYYSTHSVKVGTEEQVTVTYVKSVCQFFCQLKRNADVMRDLKTKVNSLCHQLGNMKLPTVFGTLCFAKYTDGHWYRGQIKSTKPAILVNFVDYGETVEVDKSDLLPVPKEANDIMSVPVQAVMCCLSDIPVDVPSEVNRWFEKNVTECTFRALVVAREPDGKLLVELYHGKTQINSKLRKMFQIEMHAEEQVVYQAQRTRESSAHHTQKTQRAVPKQGAEHTHTTKKDVSTPKPVRQRSDAEMTKLSVQKPSRTVGENGQRVKPAPIQLYKPPPQRQSVERISTMTGNSSEQAGAGVKSKESLPAETEQLSSSLPETESQEKKDAEKLPKLSELPSKSITPGMEVDVYVSHCNSPVSFYVQLVREEDEIFDLVDKLNESETAPGTDSIRDLHPGDLVQAEFEDDSSWYRAVVREVETNTTALVEFVDFGNTAKIPVSKIGTLDRCFLQLPTYSTHCTLSDAAALGEEEALDPKVVSAFKEDLGFSGEKVFKCKFIRHTGSAWEVSLEDGELNVTCKVPAKCPTDALEVDAEGSEEVEVEPAQTSNASEVPDNSHVSPPDPCLRCYQPQELVEGQKLAVCITTVNESLTFWCQPADSEDLEKITSCIAQVSQADHHKLIDSGSFPLGSPCLALFTDDDLWYRAEVIEKDEEELSVFFVDYGNTSKISVAHVREMPADLMETAPLALLCEMEGFDSARGSWSSGAVDEFSAITTDKVFQLTVTRVTKEDGKIKCFVQMECEGLVISEAMKSWWKKTENKFEQVEHRCDTLMEEPAPLEDQLEHPNSLENHSAVSGDDLLSEPVESPEEEMDPVLSQCVVTAGPQTSRETVSDEGVNVVPSAGVLHANPQDPLPCDRCTDEIYLPLEDKDDSAVLTMSCESAEMADGLEEEEAPAGNTTGPDENQTVATDDSGITTTDALPGQGNNSSLSVAGISEKHRFLC